MGDPLSIKEARLRRVRANALVAVAVRRGTLRPSPVCEACGVPEIPRGPGHPFRRRRLVWHHWRGYEGDAALDVVSLCDACHQRTHSGAIPEVRTGRIREDARTFRRRRAA